LAADRNTGVDFTEVKQFSIERSSSTGHVYNLSSAARIDEQPAL